MKMKQDHVVQNDYNNKIFKFLLPVVMLCIFIWAFLPAFQKLAFQWDSGDNNYCYLIVPLFIYLLWDIKDTFNFNDTSWNLLGLIPVILSVILMIFGELASVETFLYAGMWGCLLGIAFILYGWRIRNLMFTFLILLFIIPFPQYINKMLTFKLKLFASTLSVMMMRVSGLSVLQDGNIIDLGISQLQVVDACSGLRYFMPLILMALLVGYFFCKGWWRQIVLLIIVPPLSVFVNAIRIYVTALLVVNGHEELAEGFMHDFSGWLVFMVAAVVLLAVAFVLKRIGKITANSKELGVRSEEEVKSAEQRVLSAENKEQVRVRIDEEGESVEQRVQSDKNLASSEQRVLSDKNLTISEQRVLSAEQKRERNNSKKPVVITVVLCVLFVVSGWTIKTLPVARNLPERKILLTGFPMQIGNWQGERQYITEEILEALWADDYAKAVFSNPEVPNYINLLIPFYEYQGTRHTAHAPQSCILGSGWGLFKSENKTIVMNPHEITVSAMIMEKDKMKMLAVYFFYQRGRVITNPWMNKFYLMWDGITKQRTDGALVRAEMIIGQNQSEEEAWAIMEAFLSDVYKLLPEYVPN